MADRDRVVVAADQDLADDEAQDALLFGDAELVETVGEAGEEAFERVGELEVGGGVVQLGVEAVELGLEGGPGACASAGVRARSSSSEISCSW